MLIFLLVMYLFIHSFYLYAYDYIFVGYIRMRMTVQTVIEFTYWCHMTVQVAVASCKCVVDP
jgi:hypothetical protein